MTEKQKEVITAAGQEYMVDCIKAYPPLGWYRYIAVDDKWFRIDLRTKIEEQIKEEDVEAFIDFDRGHVIIRSFNGEWRYKDTGKPFHFKKGRRACTHCGKLPINGHDACLGKLPGVKNACCGHGIHEGYIEFNNGVVIRGKFRVEKYEI